MGLFPGILTKHTMKRHCLYLLLIGLLFSCKDETKTAARYQTAIEQVTPCQCFEGIASAEGDEPQLSFVFSNQQAVSVCGYQQGEIYSEFEVFDCTNGTSISQYDATESCHIQSLEDTLAIIKLKNLPGANWEMQRMPIGRELILVQEGKIQSTGLLAYFTPPAISAEMQAAFLDDVDLNKDNGLQENWQWEEILAKLEVMSLMVNERAVKML